MIENSKIKFESMNFTLFELADGVYAAIEKEKNTGSNAGIIDLGNFTVVFDTFLNIDASRELKDISRQLTGKAPSFVINSHSHTDHVVGNCIFENNIPVVSTKQVRVLLAEARKEFTAEKGQYPQIIKEREEALGEKTDIAEIGNINNELKFLRNLVKPGVEFRVPDITIEKETVFYGSKRNLHLIPFEAAHSQGDMIAYLPEDKICFMGDLLFADSHVWLGSGNPENLLAILEEYSKHDIAQYVPGHGRASCKNDLLLEIQYINEIINLVDRKGSYDVKAYSIDELSPVFKGWKSLCFNWNINFLIERKKKAEGKVGEQN